MNYREFLDESRIISVRSKDITYECDCGFEHTKKWKDGINEWSCDNTSYIKHRYHVFPNNPKMKEWFDKYDKKQPDEYKVNASRVTDKQVFYKCKYCNCEHVHGGGYIGEISRSSHCGFKSWQLVYISVSEKTQGYKRYRT